MHSGDLRLCQAVYETGMIKLALDEHDEVQRSRVNPGPFPASIRERSYEFAQRLHFTFWLDTVIRRTYPRLSFLSTTS